MQKFICDGCGVKFSKAMIKTHVKRWHRTQKKTMSVERKFCSQKCLDETQKSCNEVIFAAKSGHPIMHDCVDPLGIKIVRIEAGIG